MKKIVPDPPHHFDLPDGTTLTYTHSHRALDGMADEAARESLMNGLRAMQLAWGQADALSLALERTGSLH
ncbi:hypothetical protein [Pseudomonas sp. NPDC089396]|uniref:hypothetical protein n=1 Tax=Pseudomonas sp. NPDC089396 TaxID=3364461 RepID=UPI0038329C8C